MAEITSVELIDNSEKILSEMKKQVILGLKSIGQEAEGYAKEECPVDTGRLRNDINNKVIDSEAAVYVGTNVEYAPYVELGDASHVVGKAHFLRDSIANHGDRFKAILEAALKA